MLGAIAGDIIGSVYEWHPVKTVDFTLFTPGCRFTDDTVMTTAVSEALLTQSDYGCKLKEYGRLYPNAGYGGRFAQWLGQDTEEPYYSFGNGSAMRVSPIGFAFNTMEEVLREAARSAEVTHNHPEGVKGAQAVAAAVYLARTGEEKQGIKDYIEESFGYNLDQCLEDIRPRYSFDVTCQGSVPQAIRAFLESEDYEDAVRKAISLGGDSDTMACIAGGIAQAFYKHIPGEIVDKARKILDDRLNRVVDKFNERYRVSL